LVQPLVEFSGVTRNNHHAIEPMEQGREFFMVFGGEFVPVAVGVGRAVTGLPDAVRVRADPRNGGYRGGPF
jgi:hypothetical protein